MDKSSLYGKMNLQKWGVYMRVEIWIDLVCPYSYIGKQLFEKALADFSHREHVHVTYRSYVLYDHSLRIQKTDIVDELFVDWDCETRDEKIHQLYTCAEEFGLKNVFSMTEQPINTLDAHRLIKYATKQNKEKQMVDCLLHAHFFQGKPIDDLDCLLALGKEVGLLENEIHEILHSCKYTSDVRCETMEANELGVNHIPFMVLNETCGISTLHTPEQLDNILNTIWDENNGPTIQQISNQTTYCTADGCSESVQP